MRADYALRAMTELAAHHPAGSLTSAAIAEKRAIPEPYLDQLLGNLRAAGLVRSTRGPRGGHQLAMEPAAVTAADVVACVEDLGPVIDCLEDSSFCGLVSFCGQRSLWAEVHRAYVAILSGKTLLDLVVLERQALSGPAYNI